MGNGLPFYVRAVLVQLNARNSSGSKCGQTGWFEAVFGDASLKDPEPAAGRCLLASFVSRTKPLMGVTGETCSQGQNLLGVVLVMANPPI